MSILDEAVTGAADGELEPQMTTTAQPILATPPSCAPATSIPSGPKFTATIRFGDNKAGGHWEYMLNTSLGSFMLGLDLA